MAHEFDEIQSAIYRERERYREEDLEEPTPREINNGLCRMFARRVAHRLSFPVTIESVGFDDSKYSAHAWIAYDGRYFDAEVPEGVVSRSDLPVFERGHVSQLSTEDIEEVPLTS